MKSTLALVGALLLGLAVADKQELSSSSPKVTGTVEKVPVDPPVNHKSGSFSGQSSPASSSPYASSPVAGASGSAYSSSLGQSFATSGAAGSGDVGSQGYYYYYYPVVNKEDTQSGYYSSAEGGDSDVGTGLAGLLAGKGILIALAIGAIIILAVAGTTINLNNGRSLTDITMAATENLDVLTGLVVDAIDLYDSVN